MGKRKTNNMHWRDSDREKLERLTRNFNAKINRVTKNKPDIADLQPEKITASDLRQMMEKIETRGEYRRLVKDLESYTDRGMENTVKKGRGSERTKWANERFKRKQDAVNRMKAKELEDLRSKPMKSRGKELGYTIGEARMGTEKENALRPSHRKPEKMRRQEFESAMRAIDAKLDKDIREQKKELYRENYLKGMIAEGYPEFLQEHIKSIPIDKFIEITETDTEGTIKFVYDKVELQERIETLKQVWGYNNAQENNAS